MYKRKKKVELRVGEYLKLGEYYKELKGCEYFDACMGFYYYYLFIYIGVGRFLFLINLY